MSSIINDKLTKISSGLTITPAFIAEQMINTIPDTIWNRSDLENVKFLDICAKSGAFPAAIRRKLLTLEHFVSKFEDEDAVELAIENMIYAIAPTEQCAGLVRKELYRDYKYKGKVVVLCESYKEYEQWLKLDYKPNKGMLLKSYLDKQLSLRKEHIEKIFSDMEGNIVTFDIVVGNPPYNNDIYLDFVTLGHKLSQSYCCMITPAKWQAKGGIKNEEFRKCVVPYMREIVSYPCTKDVFDSVAEAGGISYYIIDKNTHATKNVTVRCSMQKLFETDGVEKHSEKEIALLNNLCIQIVNKCGASIDNNLGQNLRFNQSYYVQNTDSGNEEKVFNDDVEIFGGKAGGEVDDNGNKFFKLGYKPIKELKKSDNIDKYKVCISCMTGGTSFFGLFNMDGTAIGLTPASIIGPNQVPKGSYYCLKTFDTYNEAESLKSYINSRLIRFLVRCSVVGTTLTKEFFRFVPDPGVFDHIFTDKELYEKYNITEAEINIIESIIKERK